MKACWTQINDQVASYHRNFGLSLAERQAALSRIADALAAGDDVDRKHAAPSAGCCWQRRCESYAESRHGRG